MTQMTDEQMQRWQAVAERAAIKLTAFIDGLPSDEQTAVGAVLQQARGQQRSVDGDATGYASPVVGFAVGFIAGKFLDAVWDGVTSDKDPRMEQILRNVGRLEGPLKPAPQKT